MVSLLWKRRGMWLALEKEVNVVTLPRVISE